jgi:hypothetical protein
MIGLCKHLDLASDAKLTTDSPLNPPAPYKKMKVFFKMKIPPKKKARPVLQHFQMRILLTGREVGSQDAEHFPSFNIIQKRNEAFFLSVSLLVT